MKAQRDNGFSGILRSAGLKATPARLALLDVLKGSHKPLPVTVIAGRLKAVADQATVYRSLEALAEAGIVQKVDFRNGHFHYELLLGCAHHHHVVCENCGAVEDVEICDMEALDKKVLKQSKSFKNVRSHSLEFFGTCKKCFKS